MKHKKIIVLLTAIAVAVLLCAVLFFRQPEPSFEPANLSDLPVLEVGDWVFRMGTETDSRLIVKQLQK